MNNEQQSSDHRYLEQLEFKPELRNSWLNFFVTNFRVVVLLIILLSAWGIYSFLNLPRESDPEVKIPFALVTAVYPGASPTDVEELLTKKIETGIAGIKGIKKITSTSSNSFSAISIEFDTSENQEEALRKLRDTVSNLDNLPTEAEKAEVHEISVDDTPILTVALTGQTDGLTLKKYAEEIKDDLEKISGVREVKISGGDEINFSVAYNPEKLATYGISAINANQAIAAANIAIPAGNFEGEKYNYPIRTDARFFDKEKLQNIPILHTKDGALLYLKDIAHVEETNIKRTTYSRLSIKGSVPEESVTIDIIKKTGGSIINTSAEAKKIIQEKVDKFPQKVQFDIAMDTAKLIKKDFDQLTHDFLLTLILVFGVLFLIVGLKEAIVAGLAIPLVFFATFGVMQMTGTSLNFLSLFSLILSLGLLVDDAIVVVSATKQYLRSGKFTPEEAVLLVLNDFKVVLLSTTLATTWAFLPLLLSTGIIGEYIKSIPITVSVTLISSLFIALMINHPLAAVLERIRLTSKLLFLYITLLFALALFLFYQGGFWSYFFGGLSLIGVILMLNWQFGKGKQELATNQKLMDLEWKDDEAIKQKLRNIGSSENESFFNRLLHGIIHFDKLIPIYEKYLHVVISTKKRRFILIAGTFILFIFACLLPIFGIVKNEFFPASDMDNIYISIEAPTGLKLGETNKIITEIENRLLDYPEIANFSTVVGQPGVNMNDIGGGFSNNVSHLGGIVITLVEKEERSILSYTLADKIRTELKDIKGADIKVSAPSGGPPTGAAFEARIIGEDLQKLDRIANNLKPILTSIPGVVNADISLKAAPAEYTFLLKPEKLEFYNLNAAHVGSIIRMAVSGTEVSTIIRNNEEIKINAKFEEDKLKDLSAIQNLTIVNLGNESVYLRDVAEIKLNPSVDSISRIDQKRAVRLSAEVSGETKPADVLVEFQKKLSAKYKLPEGYSIVYGGENEENAESVKSILLAMIIAAILIVSTLIIQFNSFKQSLIVLVSLPLALIGVFIGLAIFNIPLSFPGLIGILALFGIVVKNAIILIDKINLNIKSDIPFYEAIVDAGKSRLEAIFITSICTILGIIPITFSNEMWRSLGSAVIFGLLLSSFLTLFIIPALYLTLVKEKES